MAVAITKQTDRQIVVAMAEQATPGTLTTGSGFERIRFSQSPGPVQTYAQVPSTENRDDGLARAPGRGRVTVPATFNGPAAIGSYDTIDAAVMRSAYVASVTVDDATAAMSSATIGISSGVVTASAGSFITAGFRYYQLVYSDEGFDSADQNKWMVIVGLTATTMTLVRVDGVAITDVAGPVAAWTIKIANECLQGVTDYAYTLEVYGKISDRSEQVDFLRWGQVSRSLAPDQEIARSFSGLGRNMPTPLATGSSPAYGSPTVTTTDALQSAQTKLVLGTSAIVGLAGFNFNLNINVFRDQTVDELTSEIGVGQPVITASATILEGDFGTVTTFLAGTDTSAAIVNLGTEPSGLKSMEATVFPKMKLLSATPSQMGQDQFRTRELTFLVDADLRGGAYAATMVRLANSG